MYLPELDKPILVAKLDPCLLIKNVKIQLRKCFKIQRFITSEYVNQINQAILLLGPLVFPRSFLTSLVIFCIFMKYYLLNQPMSLLLK
jgi:hypothetical protein